MAHEAHSAGGDHEEHHVATSKFVYVFIALCVLTTASIVTYIPSVNANFAPQVVWAFMMAVSCCKAMLVITFFMHMYWEANWKYVLTIPAAMMSVFLICMLVPDIGYRTRHYDPNRVFHDAVPKMHSDHGEEHSEEGHEGETQH